MRMLLHLSTHIIIWAVVFPFAFAFTTVARADVLHVPADFPTIQAAIDAAQDGDEIVVAPGTYFENINLLGKALHLRSSDGPQVTIIDGQQDGSAATIDTGEGAGAIIDGFSLRSTWPHWSMRNIDTSPTIVNCHFSDVARGMYNEGGAPTIINCDFFDIGDYDCDTCGGLRNVNAAPLITGCTFTNIGGDGAALRSTDSAVVVIEGAFTGNFGHGSSGTITQGGGSLHVYDSTFTANDAGLGDASAIALGFGGSSPAQITIVNCLFENNVSLVGAGTVQGAQTVIGSTFIGNKNEYGGALLLYEGVSVVEDCTFINNTGSFGPGALWTNGSPAILNSTFMGNKGWGGRWVEDKPAGAILVLGPGQPSVGGSTFCDNTPIQILGPWTNLGGNQFGPHCPVGDLTGNGSVGVADLLILLGTWGECELCGDCPADLTGDCNVGVPDLLILLANWG